MDTDQSSATALTLSNGLSRPLNAQEIELLGQLDRLKHFLATAPSRWSNSSNPAHGHGQSQSHSQSSNASNHPALNRFLLPSGEYVSCVLWSGLYHITGTDIVRALVFRFEAFGRPVVNMKKFEEGVFSDLRNLKPGTDACLEEPKSPFLDLLFKYQCIRTQKKQKVFYWFSVPHDRLFLDALERDLKREKMGLEPTTIPRGEPGISFKYDPKRTLYEQYLKSATSGQNEGNEEEEDELLSPTGASFAMGNSRKGNLSVISPADIMARRLAQSLKQEENPSPLSLTSSSSSQGSNLASKTFLHMFSLFEGSPTYKQRRKKAGSSSKHPSSSSSSTATAVELARRKSVVASEATMRRSTLSGGTSSLAGIQETSQAGMHPSLANAYPRAGESSRPQSSLGQPQSLPSYGLSMNPAMEREDERPVSHHSQAPQVPHPSTSTGETTRAYKCPLYSCGALFRRAEELKKHLPTHGAAGILRSRAQSNATATGDQSHMGGGLKFPCDRGCGKVFSRADLLRHHQMSCNGGQTGWMNGVTSSGNNEEYDELAEDGMDLEVDIQEVEVPANSRFEDDLPSSGDNSPPPPGSSHGGASTGQERHRVESLPQSAGYAESSFGRGRGHHLPPVLTAKFAPTSAETSPYVETPENGGAQWAGLPLQGHQQQQQGFAPHPVHRGSFDHHPSTHGHVLSHHMSHHNLGTIQSPPGSAHSTASQNVAGRSMFGQQQLHPGRYQSPEFNLYGYHPSSAPSHKATFDHSSLHPPTYHHHQNGGMVGLSLRRHRSAAPMMGSSGPGSLLHQRHDPARPQAAHAESRPASSAGGESNYEYGSVIVNPPNGHPFAYSVDTGDGRGVVGYLPPGSAGVGMNVTPGVGGGPASDHSSPLSYGHVTIGPNGEYADANSPYDGSNGGSPGSMSHGQVPPLPVQMNMPPSIPLPPQTMPPPMATIPFGMRGHAHSLSSEIATQQMQQYVDLDGLAGEEQYPQQQSAVSSSGHDEGYLQSNSAAPVPYTGGGSEGGSHEEIYPYQYQQQHPSGMHIPHQYGYSAPVEQQVAL